ncbi:flavodoxin-dependent (E)-4-hydroxy-3-methylbut-2-enyl-diphosphate synthase [Candidatus Riesia pediculicola]|uniref:4-hydroxy-3-methylbut-2-en-1-yl diphosphate synthase (flavodoxin) n=1 Tax=Riesia pediculicola (strain USDA) TaxID=515618 RepID=D4G8D0_RIEPU|nr:flavodoxin-dependent (E)-4-hydroxy-3-methylbut-2-enyl-diphosphate synthase [Candidatus Riesia pediculicola]ADD79606.1 4-hydroxy-3-methylbut-2-en-1-yl diphosphate synthase [Candidatus Riesia pediculicola USDA]ARC53819.1 4-hydroxy-3-methylbut-2-en-1-yl diphosphate synthase [Candidatus Riesia pediculicola]QOJ86453.1 flavodoxin-dependent (E)-4-hydroxy-3-methylbut-2-enyl-diphosphate synthase [Candidatus Riesia pediculicola]
MKEKFFIERKKTKKIHVGNVSIGGGSRISVQSMTSTSTLDISKTVEQIRLLKKAGADIVRISVPTIHSVESFKEIKRKVDIPIIADVHFNYRIALKVIQYGADCLRINPGNIGNYEKIRMIVESAKDANIPIRIGVNSGSLEEKIKRLYGGPTSEALVDSAMRQVDILDKLNFDRFKISVKSSDVLIAMKAYRLLSERTDQPIHLGITESGSRRDGSVKSAIGIGSLLLDGIGDTLRVSLADNPLEEVKVAFSILSSLKIRSRGIQIVACPTCSRKEFDVIEVVRNLEENLSDIECPIKISIIGCIVNGFGEAERSDIGIVGKRKRSILFNKKEKSKRYVDNNELLRILEFEIRRIIRDKNDQKKHDILIRSHLSKKVEKS